MTRVSAGRAGESTAAEAVQRWWGDLALRRGCPTGAAASGLDALIRAYNEPRRHYHTLDHIAALLALLDHYAEAGTDREALALAILFHDAVYDPQRCDNEAASASLAAGCLRGCGFPDDLVARVVRFILATQHAHGAPAADDPDLALLLDLDLSILAAPPAAYQVYAEAVRREYAHVPDGLYRAGRRKVLEGFLGRERIYRTARLYNLWEAPARANLEAESAELEERQ